MADKNEHAPDGFEQLRAMLAGDLKAPMGEKLGFDLIEVKAGHVVFEGTPDRSVYNPLGSVHGGDSACVEHRQVAEDATTTETGA